MNADQILNWRKDEPETVTITLTWQELSYCIKGISALGMVWDKQAREATKTEREQLKSKLIAAREQAS